MNTLFGLLLVGVCTCVSASPPGQDPACQCPPVPCPTGFEKHDVPGRCCGVCKPIGGATTVCPPVCSGSFGICPEHCPTRGGTDGCTGNELCCSNECGTECTRPIIVQSPTPNGPTTCVDDGQTYDVGDVFMSVNVGQNVCEYCQCMVNGKVTCKPGITGPQGN